MRAMYFQVSDSCQNHKYIICSISSGFGVKVVFYCWYDNTKVGENFIFKLVIFTSRVFTSVHKVLDVPQALRAKLKPATKFVIS